MHNTYGYHAYSNSRPFCPSMSRFSSLLPPGYKITVTCKPQFSLKQPKQCCLLPCSAELSMLLLIFPNNILCPVAAIRNSLRLI